MPTFYAPAGYDAPEELARKVSAWETSPLLRQVLDAMPNPVLVLNGNRQIVASNAAALRFLKSTADQVISRRPGEAIQCVSPDEGPDGCGSGRHCTVCGAVQAMLAAQQTQRQVVRDCRIITRTAGGVVPLELRITATPLPFAGDTFYLMGIEDVSDSSRLAALQRVFFHDIANTAGCIHGLTRSLTKSKERDERILLELDGLSMELIDEIRAYRELIEAEAGELGVFPQPVLASDVVEEVRGHWSQHEVARDRIIRAKCTGAGVLVTDRQLLRRILSNMLKNALEATSAGETVTIACVEQKGGVVFSVHNSEVMPEQVQLQVFQRSFTTKGERGRGIGTHSMKLLGERYLGGTVDFLSRSGEGTTFRLKLPKMFDRKQ